MTFAGVFTPVPTPFGADGQLDTSRLRAAFAQWVASPITGFVVLGSTGEAVLLDEMESDRVVVAAREVVPAGRPFIVGTGRESTAAAVKAAKRAGEFGADAVLVRTPGFFKPQMTTEAFHRHYTTVADASPVPVLLYNYTALTGVTLEPDVVAALAAHPNIVGMKESGSDMARMVALLAAVPPGFSVLAGSGSVFHPALKAGASGGILAIGALVPEACVRLYELARAGKHDEAQALQDKLMPVARLGSSLGVPGLKAALNMLGCDVGFPRAPLLPLDEASAEEFGRVLAQWRS